MSTRKTRTQFIAEAKRRHGDLYNYSLVDYINTGSAVTILCSVHGAFQQRPQDHLRGAGCALCGWESPRRYRRGNLDTTERFISKASAKHPGDGYDYSQVVYVNKTTPVTIVCPTHGPFKQKPYVHLAPRTRGDGYCGCPKCGARRAGDSNIRAQDEILLGFAKRHGDRYDYSQVQYRGLREFVTISCREHGPFEQRAQNHLKGQGCKECQIDGFRLAAATYLKRVADVYDQNFEYPDLGKHVLASDRIQVVCPSHGRFEVHSRTHLEGRSGCPLCTKSGSRFERRIKRLLDSAEIAYKTQWSHPSLTHRRRLRFDFMLPTTRTLIEFDGAFHHKPIQMPGKSWESAVRTYEETKLRDALKTAWAAEHGWTLVRIHRPNVRRALIEAGVLVAADPTPTAEEPSIMSGRTYHKADVTDPISGETVTLTADTDGELTEKIDSFLDSAFPEQPPEAGSNSLQK